MLCTARGSWQAGSHGSLCLGGLLVLGTVWQGWPALGTVLAQELLVRGWLQPGFCCWHVHTGWARAEDLHTQSTLNLVLSLHYSFVWTADSLSLCSGGYFKSWYSKEQRPEVESSREKQTNKQMVDGGDEKEGFWAAVAQRWATEAGKQHGKLTWENRLSWAVCFWSAANYMGTVSCLSLQDWCCLSCLHILLPAEQGWAACSCQPGASPQSEDRSGGGGQGNPRSWGQPCTQHRAESAQPGSPPASRRLGAPWDTASLSKWMGLLSFSLKFKAQRVCGCK